MSMRTRISAIALGAMALGLTAGCSGGGGATAAANSAAPTQHYVSDPNGDTCTALQGNGLCPGDEVTSPTPVPVVTDPSGDTCSALDGQGYCPGDDPSGSGSPGAGSPAPAAPTMTKQTDTIVFKVSGSGEPSIQYGSDSSTNNPSDGAGELGDGNYLPWTASMSYDGSALYYAVTAQLEGSGSIQDSVTEVVTTWCSGSNQKTESFPLASGQASGGYGIATAEYAGGDTGNATQAESDAGC
jgi:hypothetical protein